MALKRANADQDRKPLTDSQRRLLLVYLAETVVQLNQTYHFDELMPYIAARKIADEAREKFWKDLRTLLGLERKALVRAVLLLSVGAILSAFVGPTHALGLLLKWFDGGG